MGYLDRFKNALDIARRADAHFTAGTDISLLESSELAKLVSEVDGFRSISGGSLDLAPNKLRLQQQASYDLWRRNLLAQRLIDVNVDFIVGDGISVIAIHEEKAKSDAIQEVIDEFWYDPVNDMADTMEQKATELLLWGEVCMPFRSNEVNGMPRLGWVNPLEIAGVEAHPLTGEPWKIELSDSAAEQVKQKYLEVVHFDEQANTWIGDCFYTSMRNLRGMSRGVPELAVALTWMNTLDQTLKAQADRAKLDANFVWDITLQGKDEAGCAAWARTNWTRPQPGAVRVHNEKAEIKAVSPDLGAYEFHRHIRTQLIHIIGNYGFPLHWFGDGGEANLATASAMAEPTRKALRRKQKSYRRLLVDIVRFALIRAQANGSLPADIEVERDPFDIQMPDLSGPDMAKIAAGIQGVVTSLVVAVDNDFLSTDTAAQVAAATISETGIEIDPAKEKEKIEADSNAKAEKKAAEDKDREEALSKELLARANNAAAGASGEPIPVKAIEEE